MTPAKLKALARQTAKVAGGIEAEIAEYLRTNERRREAMIASVGGRAVEFDCETVGDFNLCDGCALHGPQACTRQHLTDMDHAACEEHARRLAAERNGRRCHDCAFRKGSPEECIELTQRLALQATPFRCHQGAPLDGKGRVPSILAFWPRDEALYPVCAGWAKARAALLLRRRLAQAIRQIRWRLQRSGHIPTQRARVLAALRGRQRFARRPSQRFAPPCCQT